jgi:DNA-binding CsgD family transcriptional regulator
MHMDRTRGEGMDRLNAEEKALVMMTREALRRVSTQGSSDAVFAALRYCTPIVGGFIGTFTRGGVDAVVSHAVGLPESVIEGWFDAPREQLFLMLSPLMCAEGGQLISDTQAIIGRTREKIDLLHVLPEAGLGEAAGYMVSDPKWNPRRRTFLTFALDEKARFSPRDHVLLGVLREDIHAALQRVQVPFVSSQSITAQLMENRQWGFILVAPRTASCIEMNIRARELVTKYASSARVEGGKYVVSSFAMRSVFETRSHDAWVVKHAKGSGELEITVHELKKEDHAISEDMWLVMMAETTYPHRVGIFSGFSLTAREEEIAIFLVETGLSYKEIADRLGTKYDTVRTQINSIYRKCGVHSRNELLAQLKGRRSS